MRNSEAHHHAAHREGGMDAHGYGVMLQISTAKPLPSSKVEEMLKHLVTLIGERSLQSGARAVGHIKCYLKTDRGHAKADIVRMKEGAFSEADLDSPVIGGSLVVNSILLGLHEEDLERVTMETILSVLEEYGFSMVAPAAVR